MFCRQCGTQVQEGESFCSNCGAKLNVSDSSSDTNANPKQFQEAPDMNGQSTYQQKTVPSNPYNSTTYTANSSANTEGSPRNVSFGEAIKLFFSNYAEFSGRSTKSEYWWAVLFNVLVSLGTSWIPVIGWLVSVALIIPGLSLGVRRLHDTGKSWTYILMGLIPLAGAIILIVQYCKDSDSANEWGAPAAN